MKPSTWEKSQSTALDPGERGRRGEGKGGEGNRSGEEEMGGEGNRSGEEEMGGEGKGTGEGKKGDGRGWEGREGRRGSDCVQKQ